MKKIFTLIAGMLFAAALFAADRRPVVKINSSKNYKIVIDGKAYFGNNNTISLDRFNGGRHTIKVFEMKRGYFGGREKLVSSSIFMVNRNDVVINIDWFGNISIREKKNYRHFGDNDRDDDWNDRDHDRRDDNDHGNRF